VRGDGEHIDLGGQSDPAQKHGQHRASEQGLEEQDRGPSIIKEEEIAQDQRAEGHHFGREDFGLLNYWEGDH
jgi:hypothetical protein